MQRFGKKGSKWPFAAFAHLKNWIVALNVRFVHVDPSSLHPQRRSGFRPHVYGKPEHPSQVSVQHRATSERFRAIKHTIDNAQADFALEACFHFQRAQHCIYSRRR